MSNTTVNTELTAWLDRKCERITNPPKGSQRSRDAVFRCAVEQLIFSNLTPLATLTGDEKIIALNALCWCARSEGVPAKNIDRLYRQYRPMLATSKVGQS